MGDCGPQPPTADAHGDSSAYEAWLACLAANQPPLAVWTGDCNTPNNPNFRGWATYEDAAQWANHCTTTPVPDHLPSTPQPPATTPQTGTGKTPRELGLGGEGSYCDVYWDDPICTLWDGGGIVLGNPGGSTTVEQPVIIQEGLSGTDVHGIIDGALGTLWNAVVGAVDGVVAVAITGIQSAITAIGNALKAAFAMLARLAGFILNMLGTLLHAIAKGILDVLKDIRDVLKHLVDDVLAPIAKAIKALRDHLLDIYKRFIRPLLIILQNLRRVLNILAAFHVPFAAKLDHTLADIERRISAPFLLLLRYTNQVANWINLIVTANYLLQKPLWLWSANAYKGETLNLYANAMTKPVDAGTIAAAKASAAAPTAKQSAADLQTFLDSGSGPYAVAIADAGDVFTQSIAA